MINCSNTSAADKTAADDEEIVLRWRVHPAREEPRKLMVVVGVLAAVAALAYFWVGSVFFAVVMVFAVCGMLADFLFPTTYTITKTHVVASTSGITKRVIAWSDVKRCYIDDFGIKLSPLNRKSRLEAYRGVYLRFGDFKDEVVETVKKLRQNGA